MKKIPLSQGNFAKVDDEDFDRLMQRKWHLTFYGYAASKAYANGGVAPYVLMHREINNTPEKITTDHVNGDRIDNRRINLRTATVSQNHMNRRKSPAATSKYKGVSWNRLNKNWRSCIKFKKQIPLGSYQQEKIAAIAYDIAAREIFGDFACLNFPNVGLGRAKKMLEAYCVKQKIKGKAHA